MATRIGGFLGKFRKNEGIQPGKTCVWLLLGIVFIMLLAGLIPFDYRTPNDAGWLENGTGVGFSGKGLLVGGLGGSPLSDGSPGVSLEIALKPSFIYNRRLPHIISFADARGQEAFYFGQWKSTLLLREKDRSGLLTRTATRIGASGVLDPSRVTVVALVSDGKETTLYADGRQVRKNTGLDFPRMIAEASPGSIVLGNSPDGAEGWDGEIFGLSLVNRALSAEEVAQRVEYWENREKDCLPAEASMLFYRFEEGGGTAVRNEGYAAGWDLHIPPRLSPLKRKVLGLPSREALGKAFFYKDAAINLSGFVPLGFFLSLVLSSRKKPKQKNLVLWGILAGAVLSLTIEANQVFLLSRDSSLTDLILNTAGGGLGALLFWRYQKRSASTGSQG